VATESETVLPLPHSSQMITVCSAPGEGYADAHVARSPTMPNKRIEFAPFGRPTRKRQSRLLTAHSRRYAGTKL
jgi:hypothetical protein